VVTCVVINTRKKSSDRLIEGVENGYREITRRVSDVRESYLIRKEGGGLQQSVEVVTWGSVVLHTESERDDDDARTY
jgi:hypothetical protein